MGQGAKILTMFMVILLALISSVTVINFLEKKGPLFFIFQTFETLLFLVFWLLVYLIVKRSVFSRYKQIYNKDIPGIFVSFIRFLIFAFAILSIIVFVFEKSIFSIAALAGLVGAGITFALGELILDVFSGVILEIEGPLEIGDIVKLDQEKQGLVIEIKWRTIILETIDETLVIVPHREFTKGFINYSKPGKNSWEFIELTVSPTIPVDRMERILGAALKKVDRIYQHKCDVFAFKISPAGVTYQLHYMLTDKIYYRETKHDVIASVLKELKLHNIQPSPYLGEYSMLMGRKLGQEELSFNLRNLLRHVSLLRDLPEETLDRLAEQCVPVSFEKGDKIVTEGEKGQSLFLIAEGYVDISIQYTNEEGETQETKIFSLSYPDSFGEMALLLNEPRSATVTAAVNTLTFEISQEGLKKAFEENPSLLKTLIEEAKAKKKENERKKAELAKIKTKKSPPPKNIFSQLQDLFK